MEVHIDNLAELRKTLTFQNEFPERVACSACKDNCRPLMIIDDEDGELCDISPERESGYPIWPHDSAIFALYMCEHCGNVETVWNQA